VPDLSNGFAQFTPQSIDVGDVTIHTLVAGNGEPLLLLHGYPQSHLIWRKVAGRLADSFTVVATDLRGYGASSVPDPTDDHSSMSKRASAADQVRVMQRLGHETFMVAAHDRGARVAHRMLLDEPDRVRRAALLDIVPTPHVFDQLDNMRARAYWHWTFLIQGAGLPETLISRDPDAYLKHMLGAFGRGSDEIVDENTLEAYMQLMRDPRRVWAGCEDYRAGATIDLAHHAADTDRVRQPLLVLWGADGALARLHEPLEVWRHWAHHVSGRVLPGGHYVPEESPDELYDGLTAFFAAPHHG
jgi:haloacetate dehalogenase